MRIDFNRAVWKNIFDNPAMNDELCRCLNDVIDAEMEKPGDEIDFALVDECCAALIELQSGEVYDSTRIGALLASKTFLRATKSSGKPMRGLLRLGMAAAMILVTVLSVNTAIGHISGESMLGRIIHAIQYEAPVIGEETTTQENTTAKEKTTEISENNNNTTTTTFVTKAAHKGKAKAVNHKNQKSRQEKPSDEATTIRETLTKEEPYEHGKKAVAPTRAETTTAMPRLISLDAVIVYSRFKTEYAVGEPFSVEGMTVLARYDNGSTQSVNIADCEISGFDSSKAQICRVTVSYQNTSFSFNVTVYDRESTTSSQTVETP